MIDTRLGVDETLPIVREVLRPIDVRPGVTLDRLTRLPERQEEKMDAIPLGAPQEADAAISGHPPVIPHAAIGGRQIFSVSFRFLRGNDPVPYASDHVLLLSIALPTPAVGCCASSGGNVTLKVKANRVGPCSTRCARRAFASST